MYRWRVSLLIAITQHYPLDILQHACKHSYKDLADIVAPNTLSYQLGTVAPKLTTILHHWVGSVSLGSIQILNCSSSPHRCYIMTGGWIFAGTWIVVFGSPNSRNVPGFLHGKPYLITSSPKILVLYLLLFRFLIFHHARRDPAVVVSALHLQKSSRKLRPKDVQSQNSVQSDFLDQVEVRL